MYHRGYLFVCSGESFWENLGWSKHSHARNQEVVAEYPSRQFSHHQAVRPLSLSVAAFPQKVNLTRGLHGP
jgi:hypothetical protein